MTVDTEKWEGVTLSSGRYHVDQKLGQGGMATVYRVRDKHLNRYAVIKVPHQEMLANAEFTDRFKREIQALVHLSHPHIVKVMDFGQHGSIPYAVMEYHPGGNLRDRCPKGQGGALPLRDVMPWLLHVAEALDFIHGKGYIHRDVKPENILFDANGNVYLSDFGVAKVFASTSAGAGAAVANLSRLRTETGILIGTPRYLAPEIVREQPFGPHIDQYALAVTVWELLSGRIPFDGPFPAAILVLHTTLELPTLHEIVPGIPPAVAVAVRRGLAKDPEQRFPNCRSFAEAILVGAGQTPVLMGVRDEAHLASCPNCQQLVSLPPGATGRNVLCPQCRAVFAVPQLPNTTRPLGVTSPQHDWLAAAGSQGTVPNPLAQPSTATPAGGFSATLPTPAPYHSTDSWVQHPSATWQQPAPANKGNRGLILVGVLITTLALGVGFLVRALLPGGGDGKHSKDADNKLVQADPGKKPGRDTKDPDSKADQADQAKKAGEKQEAKKPATKDNDKITNGKKPQDDGPKPVIKPSAPALKPFTENAIGLKMVPISAGEFGMGSPESDADAELHERPRHQVRISRSFYLAAHEVTYGQFNEFINNSRKQGETDAEMAGFGHAFVPSKDRFWATFELLKGYNWQNTGFQQNADHPVVNVSWNDATAFCRWLSHRTGKTYRLPTEAEWEYACRAGTTTRFSTGDDAASLKGHANLADLTLSETMNKTPRWQFEGWSDGHDLPAPMGRGQPNAWGLYDMHGNVAEWCLDRYADDAYKVGLAVDPRGPERGATHVYRGGSWRDRASGCRSAHRDNQLPNQGAVYIGFRVVCEADETGGRGP